MSYNGSGTFVINTAGQPVVSGTVISSTAFNALTADLATGLSTAITKDGQTTPTANIPMGNNKITGLAVGTAATDAANLGQVQSTTAKLINSVSGADTITGTLSPTLTAYAAGQMFYFVAAGDNTGAVTLNINSLGAKSVTRDGAVALAAGDIKSGEVVVVVYDGTQFQVVSQLNSSGDARFANVSIASALNVGGVATVTGNVSGAKFIPTGNVTAGNGMYLPTTNTLAFSTDGSERLRIDASGNAGLGVTPSAWSSLYRGIDIGATTALYNYTDGTNVQSNLYCNAFVNSSSQEIYKTSAAASSYRQIQGAHNWYTAASGTAGNTITFTQAMTLDASGNLGVGTTSPGALLHVYTGTQESVRFARNSTNSSAYVTFYANNSSSAQVQYAGILGDVASSTAGSHGGNLLFYTTGSGTSAERARFTDGSEFLVGKTTTSNESGRGVKISGTGSDTGIGIVSPDSTNDTVTYRTYSTGAAAYRFYVGWGGTVYATNTTISSTSDVRLKENIRDLDVGLDAVMALRPRKFDWKPGKGRDRKDDRGFIAQEIEQVFPDLIDEWLDPAPEGEEPYKSVRQDLIPVLVKAIQEQQAMIKALEAKVAALEAK